MKEEYEDWLLLFLLGFLSATLTWGTHRSEEEVAIWFDIAEKVVGYSGIGFLVNILSSRLSKRKSLEIHKKNLTYFNPRIDQIIFRLCGIFSGRSFLDSPILVTYPDGVTKIRHPYRWQSDRDYNLIFKRILSEDVLKYFLEKPERRKDLSNHLENYMKELFIPHMRQFSLSEYYKDVCVELWEMGDDLSYLIRCLSDLDFLKYRDRGAVNNEMSIICSLIENMKSIVDKRGLQCQKTNGNIDKTNFPKEMAVKIKPLDKSVCYSQNI